MNSESAASPSAGSVVLEVRVGITRDLIAEILSYGPEMRVLYPAELAQHVKKMHLSEAGM